MVWVDSLKGKEFALFEAVQMWLVDTMCARLSLLAAELE